MTKKERYETLKQHVTEIGQVCAEIIEDPERDGVPGYVYDIYGVSREVYPAIEEDCKNLS